MVSRNLKTTITVGGAIASSLPSSTKRAAAELQKLKVAQQQDVDEANRLKTSLRGLARGTDEYKNRVQQLKNAQERINYRTDELGRVGAAARDTSGGVQGLTTRFSALRAGLGPVGLALGAVTGIVLSLGAAFSKAGAEANDILISSARFGVSTETFQRGAAYMREFTQDAGAARQRFDSLLGVVQDFERVRFGEQLDPRRFLAAARLGVNVNDLIQGQIDPTALFEQVAAGFSDLAPAEARLRAEVLLGPELAALAASVAEGNLSVDEANRRAEQARILSDDQLRANQAAGQRIDEIKQILSELLKQVVSYLIPPVVAVAEALAGYLSPDQQQVELDLAAQRAERSGLRGLTGDLQALGSENVQSIRVDRAFAPDVERIGGDLTTGETILRSIRDGAAAALGIGGARDRQNEAIGGVIEDYIQGLIPRSPRDLVPSVPEPVQNFFQELVPGSIGDLVPDVSVGLRNLERVGNFFQQFSGLTRLIGRQGGGRTGFGETTLVGERGPEIAQFPAGTEIIPNNALPGFAGGATTVTQTFYVTINNPASDLDIERSLAEAAGRVGAGAASA